MTEQSTISESTRPRRGRKTAGSTPPADDLERRRAIGQFFTPSEVAHFMWEMLDLLQHEKLSRAKRLTDPACGEGVFLSAARAHNRQLELVGADIDEKLVPAWRAAEFNGANLAVANGLIDDPALGLTVESFDVVIGNPPFAGTGLKDLLKLLVARGRSSTVQRDLFDTDTPQPKASDSPLLFPAERTRLDRLVRSLAAYSCWRLAQPAPDEDGPSDANGSAGLFNGAAPSANGKVPESALDTAARTIADWPADRLLDLRRPDLRAAIQRMASIPVEVYFVERFIRLAKRGGLIAMIVPESILASDQHGPLRTWMLEQVCLLAVISLPQNVFTGVGAKARTGIIIAQRYSAAERRQIERMPRVESRARLTPEIENRKVFIAAPSTGLAGDKWDLNLYLDDIRGVVKEFARNPAGKRK